MTAIETLRQTISGIGADVAAGLAGNPKSLPPYLFYDAEGSQLFEEITALPEYYLTRTERQILDSFATEMLTQAGSSLSLVELGAGTAAKTRILIEALLRRQLRVHYCPIDVSASALETARTNLTSEFPTLKVFPMVADYTNGNWSLPHMPGRKLVLYLGSSIGNFEPDAASALLRSIRSHLSPGDALLLGTDMQKSTSVLVPAYNDASGITARFNRNVLARINRELGGQFDLRTFRHLALWNSVQGRMEMYLESTCDQTVSIHALGLVVSFRAGERIHTENSYKYTLAGIESAFRQTGLTLERTWMDARSWFAVHLIRVV
jgi:dimethylhistidine N-methyltransferase